MQDIADIAKISKSIKLLVKMKNVFFILWKKITRTFWPTQYYLPMSLKYFVVPFTYKYYRTLFKFTYIATMYNLHVKKSK